MKTFNKVCAQGDIYIRKVDSLPENAVEVKPEGGFHIVTHSETGHHHVMEATKTRMFTLPDSVMDCLLVVNEPTTLDHLRDFDTHEPILFDEGTYHVRRQREYTPEGFRRVED
tara:strand:- start:80759 stop:81097 length:339 start_codon:yes stop_codon:yes gene_type:complete